MQPYNGLRKVPIQSSRPLGVLAPLQADQERPELTLNCD